MSLEYQELAAMEKQFPVFPFATGEWRQVCATWTSGGSESPPCRLWPFLSLGVSVFVSCEHRAQGQGTPTRCSSSPGANGKGAAARGRPGRVSPRNVLRPHLHFLTFARAMPWFVLSDCSGDVGKGECQSQNRYRAPM